MDLENRKSINYLCLVLITIFLLLSLIHPSVMELEKIILMIYLYLLLRLSMLPLINGVSLNIFSTLTFAPDINNEFNISI